MKRNVFVLAIVLVASGLHAAQSYTIVGTGQNRCYDNFNILHRPRRASRSRPRRPASRADAELQRQRRWHGQRFEHRIDVGAGSWPHAGVGCRSCWCRKLPRRWLQRLADADDQGTLFAHQFQRRISPPRCRFHSVLDTKYFGFAYGDESHGERGIDCQDWSATEYVGTTMGGNPTVFGVNFADGRIKGYPKVFPGGRMARNTSVMFAATLPTARTIFTITTMARLSTAPQV